MSERRAWLDVGPGEERGVVTLDGRPERLLIERTGEARGPRVGARYLARVAEIAVGGRLAFLDLAGGETAVLPLKPQARIVRGALLDVEIAAEAHAEKAATARSAAPAAGRPGLIAAGPLLRQRLQAVAADATPITGAEAREIADEAEAAALATRHDLGGGLSLSIEATRALVAVDVDWSPTGASSGKQALDANLRALREAARLLRLKSLGGSVVIDLAGFPRDIAAILAEAKAAFVPDQPGVAVLPVSRLGLLQIGLPRRERPVGERLLDADGRLSARSVAQRLARAAEREGRADPGGRVFAACAPAVAAEARSLIAELGPRYCLVEELGWDRLKTDISNR